MADEATLALETRSPAATERLGEELGRRLRPGQGVALTGELGTGKTVLARGIARGLGVEGADELTSPSYLLMVEYPGPVPLYHFDAYFAAKERDFLADGGEVLLQGDGVSVVEWADRLGPLVPAHFLRVRLELAPWGGEGRRLWLSGPRGEWAGLLQAVGRAVSR